MTLIDIFESFTFLPAEFFELPIIRISDTIIVFRCIPADRRSKSFAIPISIIVFKSCWFRSPAMQRGIIVELKLPENEVVSQVQKQFIDPGEILGSK